MHSVAHHNLSSAIEIAIRASSWSTLLDCPARWYAIHVDGLRTWARGRTALGSALHRSTAVYDAGGCSPLEAAGELVDYLESAEDVVWDDISPQQAEDVGLMLHGRWCTQISPQYEWLGVEVTLANQVVVVEDVAITLTGTADRIYLTDDAAGPLDVKSGVAIVGADGAVNYAPHLPQLEQYRLLYEMENRAVLDAPAKIAALPTSGARGGQPEVVDVPQRSRDLYLGPGGHLETLALYARNDVWPGNPASKLCTKKYCPAYRSCRWRAQA